MFRHIIPDLRDFISPWIIDWDNKPYVTSELTHSAVPYEDIIWLDNFMNQPDGCKIIFDDAIHILKRKLFPFSYDRYMWSDTRYICNVQINVQQ